MLFADDRMVTTMLRRFVRAVRGDRSASAFNASSAEQRALEQLAYDAEAELALELGSACVENSQALVGLLDGRAEQRGLAGPGPAFDYHGLATALARRFHGGHDAFELAAPLQQRIRDRDFPYPLHDNSLRPTG